MRFVLALAAAAVLASPVAATQQTAPAIVQFGLDSDALDAPGRARLDQTAEQYRRSGSAQVIIAGARRPRGRFARVIVGLSQRRANAVRVYLVTRGVPSGVMTTRPSPVASRRRGRT